MNHLFNCIIARCIISCQCDDEKPCDEKPCDEKRCGVVLLYIRVFFYFLNHQQLQLVQL